MGTPIEQARASRKTYKGRLTTLTKEWATASSGQYLPHRNICEGRLSELERNREKFEAFQDAVEELVPDSAVEATEYEDYMTRYRTLRDSITGVIRRIDDSAAKGRDDEFKTRMEQQYEKQLQEQLQALSTAQSVSKHQSVQIEQLKLPTFNGDLLHWPEFHSLYDSAVHQSTLSDAQKLHLLKSKLVGDAATFISGLPSSSNSYANVWQSLSDRYENSRALRVAHLNKFYSLPKVPLKDPKSLLTLADTARHCVLQMQNLKLPIQHWDFILVNNVSRKLDPETREAWELHSASSSDPKFTDLIKFIEDRARAIAMTNSNSLAMPNSNPKANKAHCPSQSKPKVVHAATSLYCKICNLDSHPIFQCPKFQGMSVTERRTSISSSNLCFNCFRGGHSASKCSSSKRCKSCNAPHYTLLHTDESSKTRPGGAPPSTGSVNAAIEVDPPSDQHQVLLSTASVLVEGKGSIMVPARALLDNASQSNFITRALVNRLGLKPLPMAASFGGVGANKTTSKEYVVIFVHSRNDPSYVTVITAHVVPHVTGQLPSYPVPPNVNEAFSDLQLADPSFDIPAEIDILLGANATAESLRGGLTPWTPGLPRAQEYAFGWAVFGGCPILPGTEIDSFVHCVSSQPIIVTEDPGGTTFTVPNSCMENWIPFGPNEDFDQETADLITMSVFVYE